MCGNRTKFVILTNPRTGSEYLVRSLNRHSAVFCLGEIFSEGPDGQEWNNSGYKKENLPFAYLESTFENVCKPVCGYKQISYWLENSGFSQVEDFISQSHKNGYRFIFITREDLLKEYVSFMLMMEQKYGHISEEPVKRQIHVNPPLAYMTMRKWAAFNRKCVQKLGGLGVEYLHLVYERDFGPEKAAKQKAFDFLNVGFESIEDPLKPTNPFSLEQLIENYEEVEKYFKGKNVNINR